MARPYLILKRYKVINKGSNYKTHYKLENVTDKHCPNCDELLILMCVCIVMKIFTILN